MSVTARVNSRVTQLAVGPHLPHRTVRVRLTLLYGALFLVSGAALMAIAYALLVNAGFVFTLQNTQPAGPSPGVIHTEPPPGLPGTGSRTHPSAQTMAHWRTVAQCMRQHGVSGFPNPTTSMPPNLARFSGVVADREEAILVIPATIEQSRAFAQAQSVCDFNIDRSGAIAANHQRTQTRQELLFQSGIALAGMSLLSLVLGWLMAGRVLQPLEDSYQAQRQFVANASHELRAPLTRQRALIQVALADPDASFSSLRAAHERVLASEQHLEGMIDGLLALTRGQAGLERREHLDLATLVAEVVRLRDPELTNLDLDVRATLAPAPAVGDPRMLERLLANLLDNAIRHNIPQGQVEVTTGTRHQHAFLIVTNSGPTISPEEVPRLLQPFQRLHGTRTTHGSGNGLGLAIVDAIAAAHRATLGVQPRPGGGLTVEVAFQVTSLGRLDVRAGECEIGDRHEDSNGEHDRRGAVAEVDPAGVRGLADVVGEGCTQRTRDDVGHPERGNAAQTEPPVRHSGD
jgi:signal transduction histidine kinase